MSTTKNATQLSKLTTSPAPRRRGRPKKAEVEMNATGTATSSSTKPKISLRLKDRTPLSAIASEKATMANDNTLVVAETSVKRRGRPRKPQPAPAPVPEPVEVPAIDEPPAKRPGRPRKGVSSMKKIVTFEPEPIDALSDLAPVIEATVSNTGAGSLKKATKPTKIRGIKALDGNLNDILDYPEDAPMKLSDDDEDDELDADLTLSDLDDDLDDVSSVDDEFADLLDDKQSKTSNLQTIELQKVIVPFKARKIERIESTINQKTYVATAKSLEALGIDPYKFDGDEDDYMNKRQMDHIRRILKTQRAHLVEQLEETKELMREDNDNYADDLDKASVESDFAISLRNRDRERRLILKIDRTLARMDTDPDFGYCEKCGDEIGLRRMEARPTAELCINCKSKAEIHERQQKG